METRYLTRRPGPDLIVRPLRNGDGATVLAVFVFETALQPEHRAQARTHSAKLSV